METYNYTVGQFEKMKSVVEYFEDGDVINVTNQLTNQKDTYIVKTTKVFEKQKSWDNKIIK